MELKVTILNINKGHNRELMEKCNVLREYAQYVAKVRAYTQTMNLDEAVNLAITECIQEGILAEFLQRNRAEVWKVSIFEYDKEKEEKKLRQAEYENGWVAGKIEGKTEGQAEGKTEEIIKLGRRFGKSEEEILQLLQEELHMDREHARRVFMAQSAPVRK